MNATPQPNRPELFSEVIIVGSGPGGVGAALGCAQQGVVPVMLDAGLTAPQEPPCIEQNFYDYAESRECFDLLVGGRYEGLYNLNPQNPHVSFLLTVPKYAFVRQKVGQLCPIVQEGVSIVQSLAKGGLANAWGAAAYRYTDRDLRNMPLRARELDPYYDFLTGEIGINGTEDDLTPFYGSTAGLLPPVRLPINSQRILESYLRRKAWFNRRGVYVGRMRSAVLTVPHDGREPYPYTNADMFGRLSCFYNPVFTLNKLIAQGRVEYQPGFLVERWQANGEYVEVYGRSLVDGSCRRWGCRHLILAAGAVNTARIVLRSFADYETALPLLDNPAVYMPSFLPARVGRALDIHGYGFATLAFLYDWPEFSSFLQGLVFETMTVPRAEFYRHMPFSARTDLILIKYVLPAMVVVILYFPSDALPPARLRLRADGVLEIRGPGEELPGWVIRRALRMNRRLGLYGFAAFAERSVYGGSIHYGGCLPLRAEPRSRYETYADGRLAGCPQVWIADGAALGCLSAKNYTLTIMANAMRTATNVCRALRPDR